MNNWDYELHKNRDFVTKACHELQQRFTKDFKEIEKTLSDTRSFHLEIFQQVTTPNQIGFAGNYRGSHFSYLKSYNVCIGSHNGTEASQVEQTMLSFHTFFVENIDKFNNKSASLNKEDRLVIYSRLISHFVVTFLSIHPYANGNGHISRLIAWAMFCYKGFNIHSWDLDKRPDQPFDKFITMHQQGNKDAMACYFYQLLA